MPTLLNGNQLGRSILLAMLGPVALLALGGCSREAVGWSRADSDELRKRKPGEATIVVCHPTEAKYSVQVNANGEPIGQVGSGETKTLNFKPVDGENTIRLWAKMDRWHDTACVLVDPAESVTELETNGVSSVKVLASYNGSKSVKKEVLENPQILAPQWYKDGYFATENNLRYFNRLHINLLLLGLLLYPLLWLPIIYLWTRADAAPDEMPGAFAVIGLALSAVSYLIVLLLALLVAGVSYLVLGFFSSSGAYVPWGFASFILHIVALLFLVISLASLLVPVAWRIHLPGLKNEGDQPVKVRFNAIAMIKTFAIMVLSALATQIAGWVAGAIILAIGAGFAVITSD